MLCDGEDREDPLRRKNATQALSPGRVSSLRQPPDHSGHASLVVVTVLGDILVLIRIEVLERI
jgi:hypothetical protein